ncbi:pentapeptide repeat-containing protein [Paenibacillus sp. YYML68]|uniref:pentapeptide repeat-containing protein n=1 Tax=Paenibacillus sp. YYML68 TaxID=2909250 RepID=UPI00248F5C00|nr:pentapeptide repeat-containing protein [Paenibacillus sp. YYML68]
MYNDFISDCTNCFGLCCVALPYGKSADFPINKDAGDPCRHLCSNNSCAIHNRLRVEGFRGCVSYECFGAGQKVSQLIFHNKDWREDVDHANEMFAVFPIVQQLHEMLYYLKQALALRETTSIKLSLQKIYEETVELTIKRPKEILEIDLAAHRSKVNALLTETSKMYRNDRNDAGEKQRTKKDVDFIGANLEGLTLRGKDFRGKLMISSSLRNSDLRRADWIGADLRDADLSGADLTDALFLTQSQLNSAIGDVHTKIPWFLEKPSHWLNKNNM